MRARKLPPGPGTPRDQVLANQRERLFGAMVAAVAEHGYDKTRVADLLTLSGVSRNTFYRLFSDKQGCFLATMDAIVAHGFSEVQAQLASEEDWEAKVSTALMTLVETIAAQPAAARLYYVESYAAGREAIEKVETMSNRLERGIRGALQESPDHADLPEDLLHAVIRGLRRVIQTRLRAGREGELPEIGPQLLRWGLSYRTPPEPLRHPRKIPHERIDVLAKDGDTPRERILTAVIELMSEKGYQALTITDIARRASTSLTTFYNHFGGKDDAVVAALRRSTNRVIEGVAPLFREAPDWPHAIGVGLHAFFAFLVIEEPYARFSGVHIHSGSRLVVEVRDQLLATGQAFVAEGYRLYDGVEPIAGEAIGASIDALIFDQIFRSGGDRLYEIAPTATYLALAPFVGPDEACAIANASR